MNYKKISVLLLTCILAGNIQAMVEGINGARSLAGIATAMSLLTTGTDGIQDYIMRVGEATEEATEEAAECAICLEDMKESPNAPTVTLACRRGRHTFHKKCIKAWINSPQEASRTCPSCRSIISENIRAEINTDIRAEINPVPFHIKLKEHLKFDWVKSDELLDYRFIEGDLKFVKNFKNFS